MAWEGRFAHLLHNTGLPLREGDVAAALVVNELYLDFAASLLLLFLSSSGTAGIITFIITSSSHQIVTRRRHGRQDKDKACSGSKYYFFLFGSFFFPHAQCREQLLLIGLGLCRMLTLCENQHTRQENKGE